MKRDVPVCVDEFAKEDVLTNVVGNVIIHVEELALGDVQQLVRMGVVIIVMLLALWNVAVHARIVAEIHVERDVQIVVFPNVATHV